MAARSPPTPHLRPWPELSASSATTPGPHGATAASGHQRSAVITSHLVGQGNRGMARTTQSLLPFFPELKSWSDRAGRVRDNLTDGRTVLLTYETISRDGRTVLLTYETISRDGWTVLLTYQTISGFFTYHGFWTIATSSRIISLDR
jgi:hypothetical protein